jgi:hypothetical protein
MLQSIGRKRLNLYLLAFVSIVGFGLLLVSRFNDTKITPSSSAVQSTASTDQTQPLQPTDKTELAPTDLIEVAPSDKIKNAEQALPAAGSQGYQTACQNMKTMYTNERDAKLQAESNRFAATQQEIINKFNREGKSFSPAQKAAQAAEAKRHDTLVRQINDQYQKQLKNLSC